MWGAFPSYFQLIHDGPIERYMIPSYAELASLKSHIHPISYLMKFNRKSLIYIENLN